MTASPTARLFVALWPGAKTRAAIAAAQPAWPGGITPETAARWHLTLHFIGAVASERLAAIAAGLTVPGRPFELQLASIDAWPRGLVALCPQTIPEALTALHGALADALRRLELPVERRAFKPHVTLARRAPGVLPGTLAKPIRWPVRGYSLVVSDGRYRRIAEYPLG